MGRPVFPYELQDPDYSWLIANFQENKPNFHCVENSSLPVVFIRNNECRAPDGTVLFPSTEEDDVTEHTGK